MWTVINGKLSHRADRDSELMVDNCGGEGLPVPVPALNGVEVNLSLS